MVAAAVAKKENESVAHHKWILGLNNVSNLTGRLEDLERTVGFLQDMLKESEELMMGIVDGSTPVAGCQGRGSLGITGTVTRLDFESYKVDQKSTMSILAQKIEGGIHY